MSRMLFSDLVMFILPVEYEWALCVSNPGKAPTILCWDQSSTSSLFCLVQEMGGCRGGGGTCCPAFAGGWCYILHSSVEVHPNTPTPHLKELLSSPAALCISARKLLPWSLQRLCSSSSACLHQWFKTWWQKLVGQWSSSKSHFLYLKRKFVIGAWSEVYRWSSFFALARQFYKIS